jgi:hypothetical protein
MNSLEQIVGGFPMDKMIMLIGCGRGGGKSYTLHNVSGEFDAKLLTQSEKKANIAPSTSLGKPSTLLVKLIGRI